MSAEIIAKALFGRKAGSGWMARCPAHDDKTPSLSLRDSSNGKVLVHCHAGCVQHTVISVLKSNGLWPDNNVQPFAHVALRNIAESTPPNHEEGKRSDAALRLWQSAIPSQATLIETYFQSRALHLPPPSTLRFHPGLHHPSGGNWPAMIALVTDGQCHSPVAVLRTYLARNGSGKAPVEPPKMMLGPCRGGAVRLAEPDDVLMVGEGIETCLAVMQQTGQPAWAALSTSGLRALNLPENVRDVIVLADGDDPGEAAAMGSARRWKREGRRVRIARPPRGIDFNDMLQRLSPVGGAL